MKAQIICCQQCLITIYKVKKFNNSWNNVIQRDSVDVAVTCSMVS